MLRNDTRFSRTLMNTTKRVLPLLFYILLILFLFFYLKRIDFAKIKEARIIWGLAIAAATLGLLARFLQIYIWFVILNGLGAQGLKEHTKQLIHVYAKSWLGRYIPGTAPWILGKIYFASRHGISKNKLAVSSVLEGSLQITVVMGVAFFMLIFDRRLDVMDADFKILMVSILFACVIAIYPPIFNRLIAIAYRVLKKKRLSKEHWAKGQIILKAAGLYAVSAIINGFGLFLIAKSIYPVLSLHDLFFVMGAGGLAAAASMLAIFAPSGIGVRESIQLILLSVIMPKEIALLVVVITRIWAVAIDFIFFGLSKLIQMSAQSKG